jgi:hypothetical protein
VLQYLVKVLQGGCAAPTKSVNLRQQLGLLVGVACDMIDREGQRRSCRLVASQQEGVDLRRHLSASRTGNISGNTLEQ